MFTIENQLTIRQIHPTRSPTHGEIVVHDGHDGVPQRFGGVVLPTALLVDAPPAGDEDRLAGVVRDWGSRVGGGRKAYGVQRGWRSEREGLKKKAQMKRKQNLQNHHGVPHFPGQARRCRFRTS